MSDLIQQKAISFETIKEDLINYVQSKPDYLRWQDFLESSAGTIVIDLLAGLGAYDAYNQLARRLESYLDFARLQSSVYELAFNRGFMVPPADAPEITLNVTTTLHETINTGDLVGFISDYEVYSLESKTILLGVPTDLKCVMGRLETRTVPLTTYTDFSTIKITITEKNLARQLEQLIAGSTLLTLVDDIVDVGGSTYVLRRVIPNEVRIYLGNGILGWFDSGVTSLEYRTLTFDDDAQTKVDETVSLTGDLILSTLNSQTIDSRGTPLLETEQARGLARFYPLDGRTVTDRDYENVILKYFNAYVWDVYAYNDYLDIAPEHKEHIYLLKKGNFTANILTDITALIEERRALGILVVYHELLENLGVVITCSFSSHDLTDVIREAAEEFLQSRVYKFMRESTVISTVRIAIELSAEFGIEFYPEDSGSITLTADQFIKLFNITWL